MSYSGKPWSTLGYDRKAKVIKDMEQWRPREVKSTGPNKLEYYRGAQYDLARNQRSLSEITVNV